MGQITTHSRSERKPAVLWTPWGPMPKDGKVRLQVKSRWLPSALTPAVAGRAQGAALPRREG